MLDSDALILSSFRVPAKSVGIQEHAGVAVDNIAEIRRLGYNCGLVFSWRYDYG